MMPSLPAGSGGWPADRRLALAGLVAAVALVVAGSANAGDPMAAAGLGVLLFGPSGERSLRGLVAAIAVGALVVGLVAAAASTLVSGPLTTGLAAGLGIAVGGGLGSVVWLLAVGEDEPDEGETMTVDMAEDETQTPDPEPADLFQANPDPILFVDAADESAVVLGANPAYEDVFGADVSEGTALAEALRVAGDESGVLEATTAGRSYEASLECETADGTEAFLVRVIPVAVGGRRSAYVTFTPLASA